MLNNPGRIALGTAQFGSAYGISNKDGNVDDASLNLILQRGRAEGMNTLDTAALYGDSETRLGNAGVTDWRIISKLRAVPHGCRQIDKWVETQIRESLARLKRTSLSGLLLHRPDQLSEPIGRSLYDALLRAKELGIINKIGISLYDPDQLTRWGADYQFDIVQAPFNVFDRRIMSTEFLDEISRHGCQLHVRSAFLQGLLLLPNNERPDYFRRWDSVFTRWEAWLRREGVSALHACLQFALAFKPAAKVIVGVQTMEQLEEVMQAATAPAPTVPADFALEDTALINPAEWPAA